MTLDTRRHPGGAALVRPRRDRGALDRARGGLGGDPPGRRPEPVGGEPPGPRSGAAHGPESACQVTATAAATRTLPLRGGLGPRARSARRRARRATARATGERVVIRLDGARPPRIGRGEGARAAQDRGPRARATSRGPRGSRPRPPIVLAAGADRRRTPGVALVPRRGLCCSSPSPASACSWGCRSLGALVFRLLPRARAAPSARSWNASSRRRCCAPRSRSAAFGPADSPSGACAMLARSGRGRLRRVRGRRRGGAASRAAGDDGFERWATRARCCSTLAEAGPLWHLPTGGEAVPRRAARTAGARPGPAAGPRGQAACASAAAAAAAPCSCRRRLLHRNQLIVAKTRRGKSTLLRHIAAGVMERVAAGLDHAALAVIDPHQDLARGGARLGAPGAAGPRDRTSTSPTRRRRSASTCSTARSSPTATARSSTS